MKLLTIRELQLLQLSVMKEIHEFCVKNDIKYYLIAGSMLGAIRHGGFIPWDDDIDIAMMRKDYDKFVSLFSKKLDSNKYFLQNYDTEENFQPALSRICIKGTHVDIPMERHLKICKNTYIDVFPLDNVPDNEADRASQKSSLIKIDNKFELKLGRVYDRGFLCSKLIAKRLISALMFAIPYKKLQREREKVMRMYVDVDTRCVCSTVSKYGYDKQVIDRSLYGIPTLYAFEDTQFFGPEHCDAYLKHLYGKNYMQIPPEDKRVKPHDVYLLEE